MHGQVRQNIGRQAGHRLIRPDQMQTSIADCDWTGKLRSASTE